MVLWWKTDYEEFLKTVFELSPEKDQASKREIFKLKAEPQAIEFLVPEKGLLLFAESIYFFEPLLQALEFDEFFQVFICMLLEKTVIFVSHNMQRLCSSM